MTTRRLSIALDQVTSPGASRPDNSVAVPVGGPYAVEGTVMAADATSGAQIAVAGGVILIPQAGELPLTAGQRVQVSRRADGSWVILA